MKCNNCIHFIATSITYKRTCILSPTNEDKIHRKLVLRKQRQLNYFILMLYSESFCLEVEGNEPVTWSWTHGGSVDVLSHNLHALNTYPFLKKKKKKT